MKSCTYCNTYEGPLYPLKDWNRDRISFYCSKHIEQVRSFQEKQKKDFIDYYRDPHTRSYLSPESLALWEKLAEGK